MEEASTKQTGLLTDIYDNQARITKVEELIGNLLLSGESKTAADNHITIILMKDNYRARPLGRAPRLLKNYKKAVDALEKYNL